MEKKENLKNIHGKLHLHWHLVILQTLLYKCLKNEDNGSNQNKWYASAMTSLS